MLSSIQQIVVATDFSKRSNVAVESAATLATEVNASITLMRAVQLPWLRTPRDVNVPPQVWARLRSAADSEAESTRDHLRDVGVQTVDLALSDAHRPADLIRRTVAESGADLVVMATHGRRGFTRALLGSVTERTLRASQVPVLTVRHRPLELPLREILVPIDFAERSTQAYLTAAKLSSQLNARVHLLHVHSPIAESLRSASRDMWRDLCCSGRRRPSIQATSNAGTLSRRAPRRPIPGPACYPILRPRVRIMDALAKAAERGVRIELILAGRTDHPIYRRAARLMIPRLQRRGVAVYEDTSAMMHAKLACFDERVAIVGTSNLDRQSLHHSNEVNVVFEDPSVARCIRDHFGPDSPGLTALRLH